MEPIGRISLVVLIKKRLDAWAAVKDANLTWQGSIGHGHLAPSTSRDRKVLMDTEPRTKETPNSFLMR